MQAPGEREQTNKPMLRSALNSLALRAPQLHQKSDEKEEGGV